MIQHLSNISHKDSKNFFLIAGPCAIESEDMAMRIAETVIKITDKYKIPYIFKGSFKKANRSRVDSFTGIGDEKALQILKKVGETFNIPTTTDIHENAHAELAAQFVEQGRDSKKRAIPIARSDEIRCTKSKRLWK